MEVLRAQTAGFCMGVDLALRKLDAVLEGDETGAPIYTFGPIIHNPQVLAEYAAMGVMRAETAEEVPEKSIVIIRAHGVPKSVRDSLLAKKARIIDATCPKVKKAQTLIEKEAAKGKILLLYGEENHPEVKGLLSYAVSGAYVFDSLDEARALSLAQEPRYFLAAQTTQDAGEFSRIAECFRELLGPDMTVLATICNATMRRQEEAVRLAGQVDHMVVVGGFESGNTRRLVQVVAERGSPCVHVEVAGDLPLDILGKNRRIGLTAGASTPKKIIESVQSVLEALKTRE